MRLVVNENRLGMYKKTHEAILRAFKLRADVTLHLEDETVPSPDAMGYFDWAVSDCRPTTCKLPWIRIRRVCLFRLHLYLLIDAEEFSASV